MSLSITHLLVAMIAITSIVGLRYKHFYYSCIFHPASFPTHTKWHTLLSSSLIHYNCFHALFNLCLLEVFGKELERLLKVESVSVFWLLFLFLVAQLLANLLNWCVYYKNITFSTMGSSNAALAVMTATLMWYPFKTIRFIPFLQLPNLIWIPILIILNIRFAMQSKIEVDYLGHLAGILVGISFITFIK